MIEIQPSLLLIGLTSAVFYILMEIFDLFDHEGFFSLSFFALLISIFSLSGYCIAMRWPTFSAVILGGILCDLLLAVPLRLLIMFLKRSQANSISSIDNLVGMTGTVTAEIPNGFIGEVLIDTTKYLARSTNGKSLPAGTYITCKQHSDGVLYVEPVQFQGDTH